MSAPRPRQPAYRPRTVYTVAELRRDWAWRPRRAAMQLEAEQRRKIEQTKEQSHA